MTTQNTPVRRRASQARSKATVQRIVDAAIALIIEKAGEPVTMTEIAQRADVVIGSLYQYFADRSAIHKAILIKHNSDVRFMLHTFISKAETFAQLVQYIEYAFEKYFDLHQQDPLFNSIWSIVQTDPELQSIDIDDTLQNARYLHSIARPLLPDVDSDKLMAACALLLQLSVSTARFARAIPPPLGRQTRPIFQKVIRDTLYDLKSDPLA